MMAAKTSTDKLNNMSSAAVEKATGKTWAQWLKVLDAAGGRDMNHKQIVAVMHEKFGIGPWWQQMVTVGYEQARGLREVHQKVDGYSFSISRTMSASAAEIFDVWTKPAKQKQWMNGDQFEITKATRPKSIRLKWPDNTRVSVMLYPKGKNRAQVVIEHAKIATAAAMKTLKNYWAKRVEELQAMLAK